MSDPAVPEIVFLKPQDLREFYIPCPNTRLPIAAIVLDGDCHSGWLYDDFVYNLQLKEWEVEFNSPEVEFFCVSSTGKVGFRINVKAPCCAHNNASSKVKHCHIALAFNSASPAVEGGKVDWPAPALLRQMKTAQGTQSSPALLASNGMSKGLDSTACKIVLSEDSFLIRWVPTVTDGGRRRSAPESSAQKKLRLSNQVELILLNTVSVKCGGRDLVISKHGVAPTNVPTVPAPLLMKEKGDAMTPTRSTDCTPKDCPSPIVKVQGIIKSQIMKLVQMSRNGSPTCSPHSSLGGTTGGSSSARELSELERSGGSVGGRIGSCMKHKAAIIYDMSPSNSMSRWKRSTDDGSFLDFY